MESWIDPSHKKTSVCLLLVPESRSIVWKNASKDNYLQNSVHVSVPRFPGRRRLTSPSRAVKHMCDDNRPSMEHWIHKETRFTKFHICCISVLIRKGTASTTKSSWKCQHIHVYQSDHLTVAQDSTRAPQKRNMLVHVSVSVSARTRETSFRKRKLSCTM